MTIKNLVIVCSCSCLFLARTVQADVFYFDDPRSVNKLVNPDPGRIGLAVGANIIAGESGFNAAAVNQSHGPMESDSPFASTSSCPVGIAIDSQGNLIVVESERRQNLDQVMPQEDSAAVADDLGAIRLVGSAGGGGSVPEPSSILLLGVAAIGMGWRCRKSSLKMSRPSA